MTASFRVLILFLVVFLAVGRPVLGSPRRQERLPGFDGYCPRIVRPGDTVTLRVSVANSSAATARGTLTEISVPAGLVLDEGSVRVVPGVGAGRFLARYAASASAGMVWASTDADDAWQSYTMVVSARVAAAAVGEQLAVSVSRDSAGRFIRRVDGVVYVQAGGARALPTVTIVDMGVPETCKSEPTVTPTPTATATPTSTPAPPPYFAKRVLLSDVEGTAFSLAVVCVIDPGQSVNRPPAAEYLVDFELPASAQVALAFGPSPNIAGDGRIARFSVRPGDSAVRVAVAIRPAAGEPAWRVPFVPVVRVTANGLGDLSERSAEAAAGCDPDPALVPALVSAEKAGRAARAGAGAAAAEAAVAALAPSMVTSPQPSITVTPTFIGRPTAPAGPIAPTQAPPATNRDPQMVGILPDPRSIMLPLVTGAGVALAALAFAFIARRRGGDE